MGRRGIAIVTKAANWLTREQIDAVIAGMSAADLIDAMGDEERIKGTRMMGAAFDSAAARLGLPEDKDNGSSASHHIALADFQYMAQALGRAVNIESPLSERQEPLPASAATTE